MPNWCSNVLKVSGSKEEIKRFKESSKGKFVIQIKKEDVQEKYNNFMSAEHYKDNIAEYVRVAKMSIDDVFKKELKLIKDEHGNWGQKPSVLSFSSLLPCPEEIRNNTAPTKIISKKEFKAQEKRFADGKLTPIEKTMGASRSITKEMSVEFKKKFGADNWYDWNCANYGTKWDVNVDDFQETETELTYMFDTAWSPPVEWLGTICQMFPKLEFTLDYEESGSGFQGQAHAVDGDCSNDSWEWDGENEEIEQEN